MPALELPPDFPETAHSRVLAAVGGSPQGGGAREAARQFSSAWTGSAHRFLTLAGADAAFTDALRRGGRHPEPVLLHAQEEALFSFLSNGVAAVEAAGYALYALGALVLPDRFPLATPTDRRNATLGATMRGWSAELAGEGVTRVLFFRFNSPEFGWWKEARGVLAQRLCPGRWPDEAGPEGSLLHGAWMLRGEPIDEGTTSRRRAWLAAAITELVEETAELVARRF